eukprot:Colp12_sorted_trinity150504_noHs@20740
MASLRNAVSFRCALAQALVRQSSICTKGGRVASRQVRTLHSLNVAGSHLERCVRTSATTAPASSTVQLATFVSMQNSLRSFGRHYSTNINELNDEQLEEKASGGLVAAQVALAERLMKGMQMEKAVQFYEKAAAQGHLDAQYIVGMCYSMGLGAEVDRVRALEWLTSAANGGQTQAQLTLGLAYNSGAGVAEQDQAQGAKWFRKAAEAGLAQAQVCLGIALSEGHGVPRDLQEAAKWFQSAAQQENAQAHVIYGNILLHGQGIEQNTDLALEYLTKAALTGNASYIHGLVTTLEDLGRDQEAFEWLEQAAATGDPAAQFRLAGHIYQERGGAKRDDALVVELLQAASAKGQKEAKAMLERLQQEGVLAKVIAEKESKSHP